MSKLPFQITTRALIGALAVAAGFAALPARAANVGVSVNIGQPGFYGRIDIGQQPPPVVVYPQPVVIAPAPYSVVQRPIYLRVPPGYERDWGRYCGRYAACGQPVYFVQEGWYREHYRDNFRGPERRYDRRDDRRDDRHDNRRDDRRDGRGPGNHGH